MLQKIVLAAAAMVGSLSVAALAQQEAPPPPPPAYPQAGYPQQQQQQGYPQQQSYPQQPGYPAQAAPAYGQPPLLAPQQLDQLVQRIALYPDPLLAQVLTASTYSNQIPDAATWIDQHNYLRGDELSRAIYEDNLPFDPSVLALLPFPSVLDTMARDPGWTQALGNAVLAQRPEVMDAVQRMRQVAMNYGYLQSNGDYRVVAGGPGDIEIIPINSGLIYVPYYDPLVVFAPPRRGFYIGSAISFGPGIFVGAFAPFGWAGPTLAWRTHEIFIDHRPWARTWVNRGTYAHSYAVPVPRATGPRIERHESREPYRERR